MMETYGLVDRTGWAPGPWDGEPDELTFRHPMTGHACRARRHPEIGSWCGYVEIPRDHPWFGVTDYDALPVDVHGGLTFADAAGESWWIGFHCAHWDDISPGLNATLRQYGADIGIDPDDGPFGGTYKGLPYVIFECSSLALQVYVAGR